MSSFDASIPARVAAAALGIWLMAAPGVLGYGGAAAINDRLVGPVVASLAIIAIWEVTRALRDVNTAIGIWLLVAPWILGYGVPPATNSIIVGMALIVCSCVRGRLTEQIGGGWSALR